MAISETSEKHIIIEFRLTRNKLLAILTALFVMWFPKMIDSETLQLTTYYPAPYGGYARLLTTNQALLATSSENVGIGTTNPAQKLEVSGSVEVSNSGNINVSGGYITVPSGNITIGSPLGSQPGVTGWLRAEGLQGMCKITSYAEDTSASLPNNLTKFCDSGYVAMGYTDITSVSINTLIVQTPGGWGGIRFVNNVSGNMLCCKITD